MYKLIVWEGLLLRKVKLTDLFQCKNSYLASNALIRVICAMMGQTMRTCRKTKTHYTLLAPHIYTICPPYKHYLPPVYCQWMSITGDWKSLRFIKKQSGILFVSLDRNTDHMGHRNISQVMSTLGSKPWNWYIWFKWAIRAVITIGMNGRNIGSRSFL